MISVLIGCFGLSVARGGGSRLSAPAGGLPELASHGRITAGSSALRRAVFGVEGGRDHQVIFNLPRLRAGDG